MTADWLAGDFVCFGDDGNQKHSRIFDLIQCFHQFARLKQAIW